MKCERKKVRGIIKNSFYTLQSGSMSKFGTNEYILLEDTAIKRSFYFNLAPICFQLINCTEQSAFTERVNGLCNHFVLN